MAGVVHSDMFSRPGSGEVDTGASTGASGGGEAIAVDRGAAAAASAKDPVDKGAAWGVSGGRVSLELLTRLMGGGRGSLLRLLPASIAIAALIVLSLSIEPLPEPDRFLWKRLCANSLPMLSPLPTLLRRDSPFARRCNPDIDSLGTALAEEASLFFCLGGGGGLGKGAVA